MGNKKVKYSLIIYFFYLRVNTEVPLKHFKNKSEVLFKTNINKLM